MAVEITRTQRKTETQIPILDLQNLELKNSKCCPPLSPLLTLSYGGSIFSSGSIASGYTRQQLTYR